VGHQPAALLEKPNYILVAFNTDTGGFELLLLRHAVPKSGGRGDSQLSLGFANPIG
jgi:hypothetical protein